MNVNKDEIIIKIKNIQDSFVLREISDYIDFLKYKHSETDDVLTDDELTSLEEGRKNLKEGNYRVL